MSTIQDIYESISQQYDIPQTSERCLRTNKIYLKVKEFRVTSSKLYSNNGLQLTMIVKKDDIEIEWIEMKKSSIPNSGASMH